MFEIAAADIPSPSTTSDAFTGTYYEAIVRQRPQEYENPDAEIEGVDLSKYVTKDTIVKSARA
jgi:hypothetical protein